ncbi:hypothetical protein BCV72DRAFT_47294, partial [Rhizopus microsporus var. microsporus]
MTELIFANNFWGMKDEGYHVLTAKMNSTKKTFDEVKSFYNIRASLHEEFGRKLMKHAKASIGREETGTLYALLSSAHKEMEWTAQAHLNLAQKIKARLEVDLDNFILEQKDKRKLVHVNAEKAHRLKTSSEAYLSKVKEKYESDCAKLYTLQAQLPNAAGREADRIKQKIDRTQHEIKIQEQEYKNACNKLADATEQWNKAWKIACDTYQGMEKKRLDFLHHSFAMYINVLSTASSQDMESYERFWKALDNYDPDGDIQTFIKEKGTGAKIPEPEVFVDYLDDPSTNYDKYTLASFNCPNELVSPVDPSTTKPELTVRNPTEETAPIQATMTTELVTEPERKRSIIRNRVKPLPSLSTPLTKQKKPSIIRRSSSIKVTQKEERQQQQQQTETVQPETKSVDENGDIKIDPRAKVVLAIGNNMFDLGNLAATEEPKKPSTKLYHRRSTIRHRNADLDPSCNFSYKSLLEELGIFDNKGEQKNNHANVTDEPLLASSSNEDVITVRRRSVKKQPENTSRQESKQPYLIQQQQQPQQSSYYHYPPSIVTCNTYYAPQQNTSPIYSTAAGYPPNSSYSDGHSILFWALTLTDWFSNNPEELQYTRGTWVAIVDTNRSDGWYYGIKYDNRASTLTNEKGFVAQNCIQPY